MFYYHKTAVSRSRRPSGLDSIPAMPIHHLGPQAGMGFPRRPHPTRRPTTRIVPAAGRRHLPPEQPLNVRFQLALEKEGFHNQTIGLHQPKPTEPNCFRLVKQLETVIGNVSLHETSHGIKSYTGVPEEYLEFLCKNQGSILNLKTQITTLRHKLKQNPSAGINSIDVGKGFVAVCGIDSAGIMQVRIVAERSENATIATLTALFHAARARQTVHNPAAAAPAAARPAAAATTRGWWAEMAPAAPRPAAAPAAAPAEAAPAAAAAQAAAAPTAAPAAAVEAAAGVGTWLAGVGAWLAAAPAAPAAVVAAVAAATEAAQTGLSLFTNGERITWWETQNEAVAAFTQTMAAPEGTLPSGWRNKLEGFISDYITGSGLDMITQHKLKEIPASEWPNLMIYTTTSDSKMAILSYNPNLIKSENGKWMCKCPQTRTPISIKQVMSFNQLVAHPDTHHQLYPALINEGILPTEPINPPKRSFMSRLMRFFGR